LRDADRIDLVCESSCHRVGKVIVVHDFVDAVSNVRLASTSDLRLAWEREVRKECRQMRRTSKL
jgi:hypothetical protein